jgi:ATP-dependent helicase HrpB
MRKKERLYRRHFELSRELMKMTGCRFDASLAPENCSRFILAAYPDRVAGYNGRNYRFSGGSSAVMAPDSPDDGTPFLACAEVSNSGNNQVIRLWEKSDINELRSVFKDSIKEVTSSNFDSNSGKITARKEEKLGELVLSSSPAQADPEESARAVIREAFRRNIAVPAEKNSAALRLKERVSFASRQGDERFPDWSDDEVWKNFLLDNLPGREKINSFNALENADIFQVMQEFLGWENKNELDRSCPEKFTTPAGSSRYIDYSCDVPTLSVKVQEMFGVKVHPCVGKNRLPLKIDLLSPAMRSVQITGDLPRFWQSSWELVRKDMKSRYPKHDWPEDPANAKPHTKVKPV